MSPDTDPDEILRKKNEKDEEQIQIVLIRNTGADALTTWTCLAARILVAAKAEEAGSCLGLPKTTAGLRIHDKLHDE